MDLTTLLQTTMNDETLSGIANHLGIENEQAQSAIAIAVPLLVAALNNNAKKGDIDNISLALNKHDGSILDNVQGFLSGGNFSDGVGILEHIFGGNQPKVENAVSQSSGLDMGQTIKLLAMLAPIVMGFLGKQKNRGALSSSGGLSSILEGIVGGIPKTNQGTSGGIDMNIIDVLLNQDGKKDEGGLMDIGGKILGGLFGKK